MKRQINKKSSSLKKIVLFAAVFILAGILVMKTNKFQNPPTQKGFSMQKNTKTFPTPTPRNIAKEGRQEYSITQRGQGSIEFYKAVIDPEKVQPGMAQTMSVWVKDNTSSIKEVVAHIETDAGTVKEPMYLREGTAIDGKWVGNWKVKNTTSRTYATTFQALNEKGNSGKARIGWTDPGLPCGVGTINCLITPGPTPFSIYYADGADGGTLTWNGGSLTLGSGAVLVVGSTFNFVSGTIAVNSGSPPGYLMSGYLCGQDADADGYCGVDIYASTQANCSDVSPRTKRVGGAASGQASYCAGDGTITQNNYGYDCYDANANAKPNQTLYFSTARGDGSFDYNCNGTEEKAYPNTYVCGGGTTCSETLGWKTSIPNCGASDMYMKNCNVDPYYAICTPTYETRTQSCQ